MQRPITLDHTLKYYTLCQCARHYEPSCRDYSE